MAYEFDARKYEKASTHQKEWGNQIIGQLELRGNERILDLGCGDGTLTAQLAERVPMGQVVGVDASRAMVERAMAHATANLAFVLQDINALDYHDEFDLVFSNATLHWVKDHARLLSSTLRALKDAGVARFNFAGHGNCGTLVTVLREIMAEREFGPCFAEYEWPWFMPTADEYQALATRYPFTEARVWEENADRHFSDAHAIGAWIDQPSLVPFLPNVAPSARQAFREAVVDRMLERTRQTDGRYFETFRRVNLLARK